MPMHMDQAGEVPGAGLPAPFAIRPFSPEDTLDVSNGRALALVDLGVHLLLGEENRVHGVLHVLLHMGAAFQGTQLVHRELELQSP